ncbi:hypothetical protein MKW94_001098 [Papaver nudicaule]|uniref:Neprosin PEP catalytic domain-containing protein n=1 Tax=Papaver nudicaule TaxID=74823 RepID=A0AA41VYX1_PAPNU|nr:hypothetical protein [Papaver nudicaule]
MRAPNAITVQPPGQHVAIREGKNSSVDDPVIPRRGLKADVKVDNPSPVGRDQQSASLLWLESGPADNFSTIQTGWMVAPSAFGDSSTRLFTFWRDGPENGCFNLLCAGFVQVHDSASVGEPIEPVSEYGNRDMHSITIYVHQDPKTGNWWLNVEAIDIGYWPQEVVPYLRSGAQYIAWGGVVRYHPSTTNSPPMGNGHFPDGDITKVSAMWNLQYVDENYKLQLPTDYVHQGTNVDKSSCYDLDYSEDDFDPEWGFNFFFGGPGGDDC